MSVENHNNFDEYIKKLMSQDPIVPSGLDWGQMNITTPPKRSKRYRWVWVFLLGALFASIIIGGYHYFSESTYQAQIVEKEIKPSTSNVKTDQRLIKKTESRIPVYSKNETKGSNISFDDGIGIGIGKNQKSKKNTKETYFIHKDVLTSTFTSSRPLRKRKTKQDLTNLATSNLQILKRPISILNRIRTGPLNSIIEDESIQLEGTIWDLKNNKTNSKDWLTMYLLGGQNIGNLSYENSIDQDKTSSFLGLTSEFGITFPISKKWFGLASVQFVQIHTVFQHSRELSSIYDSELNIKRTVCEHTYHNNYSNQLSIGVGVGRLFPISHKVILDVNVRFSSSYLVSSNGKMLDNNDIVSYTGTPESNNLEFGLSPGLRLNYTISPKVKLIGSLKSMIALQKGYFVNEDINANLLMYSGVGVSYSM